MNIVFVSKECPPSPRSWGIGSYVWETGHALARIGHNVTVIAAADDGESVSSTTTVPGMTVVRLPDDELGVENRNIALRALRAPVDQGIAYRARVAECIASLVNGRRPDVIEFPGFRGESLVWNMRRRVLPMVVRMHGCSAGINGVWKDYISASRRLRYSWECNEFEAADTITVVSEHLASAVRARFGARRVWVIPNSIDSEEWNKLSLSATQELESNDILFVGSLASTKGIFVLLQAAEHLRKDGWRGRLVLAGRTTPEFERFIRLRTLLDAKLPNWVVYLGTCARERLAGLYRDAGVCCFPSLLEAFSYACLEAMACGGLVLGSQGTGMTEILTETSGFLVRPGEVSALVVALYAALSIDDEHRKRMKKAAMQRVRKSFDNSIIIPKLLNLYQTAIEAHATQCLPTLDSESRCS